MKNSKDQPPKKRNSGLMKIAVQILDLQGINACYRYLTNNATSHADACNIIKQLSEQLSDDEK